MRIDVQCHIFPKLMEKYFLDNDFPEYQKLYYDYIYIYNTKGHKKHIYKNRDSFLNKLLLSKEEKKEIMIINQMKAICEFFFIEPN